MIDNQTLKILRLHRNTSQYYFLPVCWCPTLSEKLFGNITLKKLTTHLSRIKLKRTILNELLKLSIILHTTRANYIKTWKITEILTLNINHLLLTFWLFEAHVVKRDFDISVIYNTTRKQETESIASWQT